MEHDYWHEKWKTGRTAFHEADGNRQLHRHIERLGLSAGDRVFVPLCGKSRDVGYLRSQGFRVVAAELSPIAVDALFEDLQETPTCHQTGPLERRSIAGLDVFLGDIFDLTQALLGPVDAVFDRAALVALPPAIRQRYADHLIQITGAARQLVISYDYDQSLMDGPPFSVPAKDIQRLYAKTYDLSCCERHRLDAGLKHLDTATEEIWLLSSKTA